MRGFAADVAEPLVGEIRAIRGFDLSDDGLLFPIGRAGAPWTPSVNTARCLLVPSHTAPVPGCRCGFYAYLHPDWAEHGAILGVVSAWGDTIVGTRGIRAQYARIEAVCLPSDVPAEVRAAVQRRYPGIVVLDSTKAMLARFPLSRLPGVRRPLLRGAVSAPTPTGRWVIHAIVAAILLALPVIDWTVPGVDLRSLRFPIELAALALGTVTVRNSLAHRGWGPTFTIRLGAWLGMLVLPWLLGPPSAEKTIALCAAVPLVCAGFVRNWQRRGPRAHVIPTSTLRESLRSRHRTDWRTTTRHDRGYSTAVTRSSDDRWVVQYVAVDPPGASRRPKSLRVGMPQYLELLRAAGRTTALVCVLDWRPSAGWVQVIPNTRTGLTRHTFAMSVDDLADTLGLPPEALGRTSLSIA